MLNALVDEIRDQYRVKLQRSVQERRAMIARMEENITLMYTDLAKVKGRNVESDIKADSIRAAISRAKGRRKYFAKMQTTEKRLLALLRPSNLDW